MPRRRALLRQSVRRLGTFQRGTASNGTKAHAPMILAHISMKSLHRKRIEVNQDLHQTEGAHHQGVVMTKARRNSHANFGNKADATGVQIVGSAMRGNNPSRLVLPLLPGLRRMIRKEVDKRTAGAREKAGIVRQSRRDQGVQGIAVPRRGIKVSQILPKLPQRRSA